MVVDTHGKSAKNAQVPKPWQAKEGGLLALYLNLGVGELLLIGILGSIFFLPASVPIALSVAFTPEDIQEGRVQFSEPCPHLVKYGKPCNHCGMTRAFAAIGHGRWKEASQYNPLAPWFYGACLLVATLSGTVILVALTQPYVAKRIHK